MKVYFNHRAELCDILVRFGFTNDILRSLDYADVPGVELRDAVPDPNEGCLMPPAGATVVLDIPEAELLPHEVLAENWEADGFRRAGMGYREFVVPAAVVNRYPRQLYDEASVPPVPDGLTPAQLARLNAITSGAASGLTPAQLATLDQITAGQHDQDDDADADDDGYPALPELIGEYGYDIAGLAERLDDIWDHQSAHLYLNDILGLLHLAESKLREIVADAEEKAGLPPRCAGCGKVMDDPVHHGEDGGTS